MIIGIDIGGTKTKMGYLRDGRMQTFFHERTPRDPDVALDLLTRGLGQAEVAEVVSRIGIGCPGPLDPCRGVVLSPPNLPEWKDFSLSSRLAEALGVPVRLGNDANVGALGEAVYGSARGAETVFYMTISTGIGTGIVSDGRVHGGARGLAGELWAFDPSAFGGVSRGNVNELASGTGLIRQAERALRAGRPTRIPADDVTSATILRAFGDGDPLAVEIVERARQCLAATLAFVVHVVAPDVIVLGGGLCTDTDWFVRPLQERVPGLVGIPQLRDTPIRRAELWDDAVLYGAISLFK